MKIEIKKGFKSENVYIWGNGGNTNTSKLSTTPLEYIEKDVYDYYYKLATEPKTVAFEDIKEGSKVCFMSSAVFPRHKLKEIKNLSITRKIENADYIVINKNSLASAFTYVYSTKLYTTAEGIVTDSPNIGNNPFDAVIPWSWKGSFAQIVELEKIDGKKLILDSDLSKEVPREVTIQGDLYSSLHKMLGCKDKETIKVGTQILSNLNYKEHKLEVVLLLNKHYDNMRSYGATHVVMFKSLLDAVTQDYPNFNSSNKLAFILEVLDNHRDDETTKLALVEYLNSVHKISGTGKYKIEIVDELEIQ